MGKCREPDTRKDNAQKEMRTNKSEVFTKWEPYTKVLWVIRNALKISSERC
jgi:hypothetical protein